MFEELQQQPDYTPTLERAASLVGGRAELAAALKVAERQLEYWIDEKGMPPHSVFLDAIDIIIENAGGSGTNPGPCHTTLGRGSQTP